MVLQEFDPSQKAVINAEDFYCVWYVRCAG